MGVYTGTAGDDTFLGSGGADTMTGLAGNDTYYVDDAGDVVVEAAGGGNDRVAALISYILSATAEVEQLEAVNSTATSALDLTANDFVNVVIGNAGVNMLFGLGGNDTLIGNGGNDFLIGGTGADLMYGGTGNDTFYVDDIGDRAYELAGEGNADRIATLISYTLDDASEVELLEAVNTLDTNAMDLTGSSSANQIIGNAGVNLLFGLGGNDQLVGLAGNDFLVGGTGADIMYGGTGDDTYYVDDLGDRANESAGEGNDRIATSISYTLDGASEVELLEAVNLTATVAMNLTGSDSANTVSGNDGANVLRGEGGNDVLNGRAGDDFLVGGAGADLMTGGTGNDTYYVDNAADLVAEAAGQGNDRISALVSYALAVDAEVELIEAAALGATDALNLTGSNTANTIYGNNGVNILNGAGGGDTLWGFGGDDYLAGGAGGDTLWGGAGNDTYYVDNVLDVVMEGAGDGTDRVAVSVSYVLAEGAHVELIEAVNLSATDAIDITGSFTDNIIYGNDGANVINGSHGFDTLRGFGGADTFVFDTVFAANNFLGVGLANVDTILDFTPGVDKIRLGGEAGQPFAAMASGALLASAFSTFGQSGHPARFIIYNVQNGELSYAPNGGNDSGMFQYIVFAKLAPGLTLTAADFIVAGAPNHAPVLAAGPATATVAENSPVSTIVYQANATDADGDRIVFTLSGADAGKLAIDGAGKVHLLASGDFESQTTYSFTIIASDSGASVSRDVTLIITDVDETPHTPIIVETTAANDTVFTAQDIQAAEFVVAENPNLPNDDLKSATITGSLPTNGDKDFFSIFLVEGQLLVLDVDGTTNGLDSLLRLYRPNRTEIGSNDDLVIFDPGSNPPYGHNTDSQIIIRVAQTGTYYFSIESFEGESSGDYQINVSVGGFVSPAELAREDVEALLGGASWDDHALTYGFPTLASQYPESFEEPDNGFAPFNAAQQSATTQLLQLIANVTNLTFAPNQADPGNADLRYAMSTLPQTAFAYYPTNEGPGSEGGSAWFNPGDYNAPVRGDYAWMSILHETGHALGLKHGHDYPWAVSEAHDSLEYTVMTYRSYVGQALTEGVGFTNENYGFPQTLMMYDIAALQQLYGANYGTNAGDTVYRWSPSTGELSIDGAPQGAPGANRILMTIWDGGGSDTYDFSNYASGSLFTIDLRPGEWTKTGGVQTVNLGDSHFARGNVANAMLHDNDPRSLIENAIGSQVADTIIANQAANRLTGNGGADRFTWLASSDAGTGAPDTILDFQAGSDRIDLSAIDAVIGTSHNDVFTFIGTGAFTSTAGQLRYEVNGGNAHIFADLDGNGVADMAIVVSNIALLNGADFIL